MSARTGGTAAGRDISGSALGDHSRVTNITVQHLRHPGRAALGAATAVLVTVALALGIAVQRGWLPGAEGGSGTAADATPRPSATVSEPPRMKLDNSGGWGPDRKTYTMKKPAIHPVFNSITDHTHHGDARNFLQCRDKRDGNEAYWDQVIANDGHTYVCYLFFSNDIAPGFDTRVVDGKEYPNPAGALQNARARVLLPAEPLYNPAVRGHLSADNSGSVWDSCNFVAPRAVRFTYVTGSAEMHTRGVADGGVPLKETRDPRDRLVGRSGALLGDDQDGYLYQHSGYLLFEIKVSYADV
ncbi:hypothetical protein ACIRPP_24835 [Streptomyces sp. NPDC101219]|uniref:hypothetical protein n=1 Tax=Streptomyces sp. NPDC101219 TaxID=3366131 RepID=UPI00382B9CD9